MNALLLSLLLWVQGIPIQPTQGGTVTGVLRSADGRPAPNVRVAAVPQLEATEPSTGGPTLSSIAETDEQGRYKLENIPPGRYYIAAGRLDLPTFYPGTQSMALGQAVGIVPGGAIQGIDFVLNATSSGRADPFSTLQGVTLLDVPLDVRIEGGGKLPLFSGGTRTSLKLTPVSGGSPVSIPINAARLSLAPPIADYRITVEGLPEGYKLKSARYGVTDLPDLVLHLTGISVGPNGTISFSSAAAYTAFMTVFNAGRTTALPPTQPLSVVIDSTGVSAIRTAGARVSGRLPANTIRPVQITTGGATVFFDGTFEFRNLVPGSYVIHTVDNSSSNPALVASIVIGSADLDNVDLQPTPVPPRNIGTLPAPGPANGHAPGVLGLGSLRGHILDSETGEPLKAGTIFLVGDSFVSREIGAEGIFEFPHLLPGSYDIEVQGIGYPTLRRTIAVEETDLDLELKVG